MISRLKLAVYHNLAAGGAKRAAYELVKGIGPLHDIDLFTPSCADEQFCNLIPHVQKWYVFDVKIGRFFQPPFGRLNQVVRLHNMTRLNQIQRLVANQIDSTGYDLAIIFHDQFFQAPALLHYLKTPTIYFAQESLRQFYEPRIGRPYEVAGWRQWSARIDPLRFTFERAWKACDGQAIRAADLVLCNSRYSQQSLCEAYGINATVCYLGVDTTLFCRHSQRPGATDPPFILSVGAIAPRKGFDFLIESIGRVNTTLRPRLMIAGNGVIPAELEYLQSLAKQNAVNIEFHLHISDSELVNLYNGALMTISTPIREPFGLVSLESMACGTPVVGVAEGGVTETIIHGQTGLLTERNPAHFASAIEYLLVDDDLRYNLGSNGYTHVREHWRWDEAVERFNTAICTHRVNDHARRI